MIANETVGGEELLAELRRRVDGVRAQVFVVSPALNSKLRHWVSDEDQARVAAQNRLDESLEAMRAAGIEARGQIGDSDPLQAIEDGSGSSPPTSSSSRRTRKAARTGSSAASSRRRASGSPSP